MKTTESLQEIMTAMCSAAGLHYLRSEQDGKRPTGVFLSYKIILQEGEPSWKNSEEITEDPDDDSKAIIRKKAKSILSVSCTIIGPGKEYRSAWDKAIQCAAWLESEDATEIYEAQGVIPIFNPITIQDRSSFLETGYETRLGFDVIFTAVNVTESATDSVDLSKTIQSLTEA